MAALKIETGDVDIFVGSSSADLRQSSGFHISKNAWIDGKDRKFYSIGKIQDFD